MSGHSALLAPAWFVRRRFVPGWPVLGRLAPRWFARCCLAPGCLAPCVLLLLAGCQRGTDVAKPPAKEARPRAVAPALPASPPSDAGPDQTVSLALGPSRAFRRSLELVELRDGVSLSRAEFEGAKLRAATPRSERALRDGRLLVALDEQTPRPLLATGAPLRAVVDEDRELSPGWHVLVAFVEAEQDIELQVARFQLELTLPLSENEAKCLLLLPGGTVFAGLAGSVDLVAAPLADGVRQFEYFAGGSVSASLRTQGLEGARVSGLPSGDHRLGVRCYDSAHRLLGQTERTVTINLDEGAPGPGAPR